nr:MAG TPA: hypothetical protein [Caudoviricetes sp.]
MSEEKSSQCLPSQVTINIGTSGVKINDEGKPPAPAVDLTKYVTREAADSLYAPRTQVEALSSVATSAQAAADSVKALAGKALTKEAADAAYTPKTQTAAMGDSIRAARAVADEAKASAGAALTKAAADEAYASKGQVSAMGDSIRATRSAAEQTKADGEATKTVAQHAEELTQVLARNLAVFPRVLRLDKGQAVPAGTPLGTVIVRTERAISNADDLFPPIGEWPKISAAETGDGVRLDFQHPALAPGLDQLKSSEGRWEMVMTYSFPGGNFGEEEAQVNLWTARRYQEEGHPPQVDQGSKIDTLTVKKGDHLTLKLDIEPKKVDDKLGDVWGIWMDAPITALYVHDIVIRRVA